MKNRDIMTEIEEKILSVIEKATRKATFFLAIVIIATIIFNLFIS